MLDNLRKMIDGENERDFEVEAMLEAMDTTIADMFIEEDGEADIPENELNDILNKIPAYDEEAELNKKLKKITESYIPEEIIVKENKEDNE